MTVFLGKPNSTGFFTNGRSPAPAAPRKPTLPTSSVSRRRSSRRTSRGPRRATGGNPPPVPSVRCSMSTSRCLGTHRDEPDWEVIQRAWSLLHGNPMTGSSQKTHPLSMKWIEVPNKFRLYACLTPDRDARNQPVTALP